MIDIAEQVEDSQGEYRKQFGLLNRVVMLGFIEQGKMSQVMPSVKESAMQVISRSSSKSGQKSLDNRPVCLALPL